MHHSIHDTASSGWYPQGNSGAWERLALAWQDLTSLLGQMPGSVGPEALRTAEA